MKKLSVFLCVLLCSSSFLLRAIYEKEFIDEIIQQEGNITSLIEENAARVNANLIPSDETMNAVMAAASLPTSKGILILIKLHRTHKKPLDNNVQSTDDGFRYTPLMFAIQANDKPEDGIQMIKYLVNNGTPIDYTLKSQAGKTTYDMAKEKGYSQDILDLLREPEKVAAEKAAFDAAQKAENAAQEAEDAAEWAEKAAEDTEKDTGYQEARADAERTANEANKAENELGKAKEEEAKTVGVEAAQKRAEAAVVRAEAAFAKASAAVARALSAKKKLAPPAQAPSPTDQLQRDLTVLTAALETLNNDLVGMQAR